MESHCLSLDPGVPKSAGFSPGCVDVLGIYGSLDLVQKVGWGSEALKEVGKMGDTTRSPAVRIFFCCFFLLTGSRNEFLNSLGIQV